MKTVTFKKLVISNFKGIEQLSVDFGQTTKISGDNGTGKSTIFDAITWCLFGKNSQNDQKFGIKNSVKTELNRADHIVELTFSVNDEEITAKRVYKEKWQKKRGSEETEFTGNETLYFWNNVPCSQGEYQSKINGIMPEDLFKLLTNPMYFNITLKETDRRDVLVRMAGEIPNEKVINGTPMFQELFAKLKGQKSLEELRKEVAYEKSSLRKLLGEIPARIDELIKSTPKDENWSEIETEINQKQKAIKTIDDEVSNLTSVLEKSNQEAAKVNSEIQTAIREMGRIEMTLKGEADNEASRANMGIRNAQFELEQIRKNIQSLKNQIKESEQKIERWNEERSRLRSKWSGVNSSECKHDENCPTCRRPWESADITETHRLFNLEKQEQLQIIATSGMNLKGFCDAEEKNIFATQGQISEFAVKETELLVKSSQPQVQPQPIDLSDHAEYQRLKAISEKQIPSVESVDISDQQDMKKAIQEGIDALRVVLSNKVAIDRNKARIDELKAEEKLRSKELADLEKTEFAIESFQKKRMELVEGAVNDKFKLAKFKLFRTLVNGGEEQCCETMYNEVVFSDLNRASQINVGIDISNALCQFYGVSAPIVVDNSEAVNHIHETDSQLITLYVTNDKTLTVN